MNRAWNFAPDHLSLACFFPPLVPYQESALSWSASGLSPLDVDIKETERSILYLENLDSRMDQNSLDHRTLIALNNRHKALLKHNSIGWAQRTHMLWLEQGDLNSKFFQNMAHTNTHRNKISIIQNNVGNSFTDQASIENCFSNFFLDLWGAKGRWSFEDLVKALPPDHNSLSNEGKVLLTKPVSYLEILNTIKSMAKGKSPRPDGLNMEFYLFYWDIIKKPLLNAISYFFSTANLHIKLFRRFWLIV